MLIYLIIFFYVNEDLEKLENIEIFEKKKELKTCNEMNKGDIDL